ncbi:uncharacterized protein LOC120849258 [Ixodes scapularis]|uniref:uncharacterized protein LOC120849258 n=1 Tax=Ixodes scapularis TaxID=6945 RepID=UPI001A9CECD0|nr:uncharacterized protein LOC120849258 [Ixodes scapularis]
MKATLVAICFIAGAVYSVGRLTEQQCRTAVPTSLCNGDAKLRTIYYFSNHTNKCESMESCTDGVNHFEKKDCCTSECPYGKHSKTG